MPKKLKWTFSKASVILGKNIFLYGTPTASAKEGKGEKRQKRGKSARKDYFGRNH